MYKITEENKGCSFTMDYIDLYTIRFYATGSKSTTTASIVYYEIDYWLLWYVWKWSYLHY